MKPSTLFFTLLLNAIAGQAHAKSDCSEFMANFIGLDAAIKECNPTPKFNAWANEERARLAATWIKEERALQETEASKKEPSAPGK